MTAPAQHPLSAAVIGAGAISLQHLPFLASSDRTRLVGVCDLSPVAARTAGRRHGGAAAFTDPAAMLAELEPEVVHVLTPPHTHGPLVRLALDAGAHVICEKPLGADRTETADLLAAADAAGRRLVENHNYLFNDEILDVAGRIDRGDIGTVTEIDIRLALGLRADGSRFADASSPHPIHGMPAGVIHDFITHFAYLLDQLAGRPQWDRVHAFWSNHGGGDLFSVDDLDATLIGVDAQRGETGAVHGRLRFSCRTLPETFSIVVRGSDGELATDLFHPFVSAVVPRPGGPQLTPIVNHIVNGLGLAGHGARNFGRKLLQHGPYHGLDRFLDLTYAALQAGEEPPVTTADIMAASELIDRIVAERGAA